MMVVRDGRKLRTPFLDIRGQVTGGRRAGPAVDRLRARLRRQRAVLRLLHRQRPEPADRRVPARERGPRRSRLGAARAADAPTASPTTTAACCCSARTAGSTSAPATAAAAATSTARAATRRTSARCWARSCGSTRAQAGGRPYQVPARNPFVGRSGARGEIYSYGLRNPWRFSFDRRTGDLAIGDVGQNEVEEIDFVRRGAGRGANFGWRAVRGPQRATRPASRRRATSRPVIVRFALRRQLLDHRRRRGARPRAAGAARPLRVRRLLPRAGSSRRGSAAAAARDVRDTRLQRRRACPRSARTRRGRVYASRSTARSTGSRARGERPRGDHGIVACARDNPCAATRSTARTPGCVGRDPAWVVDPGPGARRAPRRGRRRGRGARRRGRHRAHARPCRPRRGASRRCASGSAARPSRRASGDVALADGDAFGPLHALATARPRRRPPRVRRRRRRVHRRRRAGRGQRVRAPDRLAAAYLDGLRAPARARPRACSTPATARRCADAGAKLDEYLAHRLERERRLRGGARRAAPAARTRCSTPPGPTRPRRCARPPRSR